MLSNAVLCVLALAAVFGTVVRGGESQGRECGIIVFIHVGKTGGTTVADHLHRRKYVREYVPLGHCNMVGGFGYEDQWHHLQEVVTDMSQSQPFVDRTPVKYNKLGIHDHFTQGLDPNDPKSPWWALVDSHTCTPGLMWSFERFLEMKRQMEQSGSGCRMILATAMRNPESRFWSNYFYQAKNGKEEFQIPKGSDEKKQKHAMKLVKSHPNPQSTALAYNCDLTTVPSRPNCSTSAIKQSKVRHNLAQVCSHNFSA